MPSHLGTVPRDHKILALVAMPNCNLVQWTQTLLREQRRPITALGHQYEDDCIGPTVAWKWDEPRELLLILLTLNAPRSLEIAFECRTVLSRAIACSGRDLVLVLKDNHAMNGIQMNGNCKDANPLKYPSIHLVSVQLHFT